MHFLTLWSLDLCQKDTMTHTYKISGMTCGGCQSHVEKILLSHDAVQEVTIDLSSGLADITFKRHIHLKDLQQLFADSRYSIHGKDDEIPNIEKPKVSNADHIEGTQYYCPMQCEGDKLYDKPGDCPICGMDLILVETSINNDDNQYQKLLKKFWIASLFTLPIFTIAMSEMIPDNPLYNWMKQEYWNWVQLLLSIPVVFYATWVFFKRAYSSIRSMNLNMFTLIGIGAGAAWLFSLGAMLFPNIFPDDFKTHEGTVHVYFEAATVILTLVMLGQVLEAKAHSKTNSAIKELMQLAPNKATRITNDGEEEIDIDAIEIGNLLKVKPGEKIPVDGRLTEGSTSINESMITGEPIPVDKETDDRVIAGTINGNQSFVMQAENIGSDTLLAKIIEMVSEASRSRAPIQKLADTISKYFVPLVIAVSTLTFIVWYFFGPSPQLVFAFVNAIAVLIIACPCALGLATPMSVMVGIGKGAKEGVLIKNAEALENLNKIDTLIIDKTGTITEGKPSVDNIVVFDSFSKAELIQMIASVNSNSEHPLAAATVHYAQENKIELRSVSSFLSITGMGVQGTFEEKRVLIGNEKLMTSNKIGVEQKYLQKVDALKMSGKTVPFIAVDGKIAGAIVLADAIKKTSKMAIEKLQRRGLNVIMMTGDNEHTARAVSKEIHLSDFVADCLPEDKKNKVEELQKNGRTVAMIGDGINDAPALALADVGISMGTGTDIAMQSSQITLVSGDLTGILKAFSLSKKVMRNIKQNLFFALAYNTLGIPIAAGLLYPLTGALLSPMIAALAMSFSSVSVIGNSLRLRTQQIQ